MITIAVLFTKLFAANFGYIAIKALQQRNVQHLKYIATYLTSQVLAVVEVYVIWRVAEYGMEWWVIVALGQAGGLGACLAMYMTRGYERDETKRLQ